MKPGKKEHRIERQNTTQKDPSMNAWSFFWRRYFTRERKERIKFTRMWGLLTWSFLESSSRVLRRSQVANGNREGWTISCLKRQKTESPLQTLLMTNSNSNMTTDRQLHRKNVGCVVFRYVYVNGENTPFCIVYQKNGVWVQKVQLCWDQTVSDRGEYNYSSDAMEHEPSKIYRILCEVIHMVFIYCFFFFKKNYLFFSYNMLKNIFLFVEKS